MSVFRTVGIATIVFPSPFPLAHSLPRLHSAYAVPSVAAGYSDGGSGSSSGGGFGKRPYGRSVDGEPAFTTFHSGIQTCVDYMWYSATAMERVGIMELLPFPVLFSRGTLPTREWSSDHMSLVVDLAWR